MVGSAARYLFAGLRCDLTRDFTRSPPVGNWRMLIDGASASPCPEEGNLWGLYHVFWCWHVLCRACASEPAGTVTVIPSGSTGHPQGQAWQSRDPGPRGGVCDWGGEIPRLRSGWQMRLELRV